jgi:glucosamine-6-phosphate deaminase
MTDRTDFSQNGLSYTGGKFDDLNVRIYRNRAELGADAALLVCDKINQLLLQQDVVNVIFAAAPSQNEFLAGLVENGTVDWTRVHAFHMDEYIGLSREAPQLFASFLEQKLFGHLPFRSVNYINGNAAGIQGECDRYAAILQNSPADVVCLGIGENGHLAFNDPPVADFNDPVKVKMVTLDAECRQQQVNDGCFGNIEEVPTHAITLTIPALMAGRFAYCMVPGPKKAKAIEHTLNAGITEAHPSTILRKHPNAILFLDNDSSSLLQHRTGFKK